MARIQLVGLRMFKVLIVSSYTQDVFDHTCPSSKVEGPKLFLLHSLKLNALI